MPTCHMPHAFDEAVVKPEILIEGKPPFPAKWVEKDKFWDKVFAANDHFDGLTLAALTILLPASLPNFENDTFLFFACHFQTV